MSTEWLLVAHNGGARLSSRSGAAEPWEPRERLEHEVHHADDLVSDRAGRAAKGTSGHRMTFEPEHTPREVEEDRFVREAAALVDHGARTHACEALTVVAPPRTLGKLRAAFPPEVTRRVVASFDRDYAHLSDQEVYRALEGLRA